MDHGDIHEVLILFSAAVLVLVLFLRVHLPPVLGYLALGVGIGPYGLGWVGDTDQIRVFAEFGVVFLLFTVGLEFSLPQLMRMKGAVLGLGGAQVILGTAITTVIAMQFGVPLEVAILLGGVITMSSTALVTKQLTDQVELHSRHGRNSVGILLFQDIMVIPFLILAASLAGATVADETSMWSILISLVEGLLALVLILALGHWGLRPLFREVARFRSTELFTLTVLLVTLGAAWATASMGLSLALGAFIAGMMLGETEFRHQVEAEIRPFRDVLLGLFFITVGMLLNTSLLPDIWPWVLALLLTLIVVKLILVVGLCRLAGWDSSVSLRTGLVLAHGGEFGFAILTLALTSHVLEPEVVQIVLGALILSMGMAPLIIRNNGAIVARLLPVKSNLSRSGIKSQIEGVAHGLSGHVIICGYGRVGQNVARFLEEEDIKFVALDMDPLLVQNAVAAKEPVSYGDSSSLDVLSAAGLGRAAAVVISQNDVHTSLKILSRIRGVSPDIPILVRTADDSQLERLLEAGATEVVPETLEASLMISSHLLVMLHVPGSRVLKKLRKVRQERYSTMRRLFSGEEIAFNEVEEGVMEYVTIEMVQGCWAIGRKISELDLPAVVAVTTLQRGEKRIPNPEEGIVIYQGDELVLFGPLVELESLEGKFLHRK